MKKQTFPEMTLTSLASNYPTFLQGKELYKKGKVTNLKADEKNNTIQTSVEDKQLQTVHLRFYPNGVARKYHCTCKAFEKNTGACRHVVASMMHLNDLDADDLTAESTAAKNASQGSMFSYKKSEKAINALIHFSKKEISRQTDILYKQPVYVEYMLNVSGTKANPVYELYFKMGKDYLYVIKNSSQLIDDIVNEEDIVFGKNFTFNTEDYALMPEDKKVFDRLSEIQTVIKSVLPMGYENQFLNKDSFTLPPSYIKEILSLLDKTMGAFVRFGRPPRQLSQADRGEALMIEDDLSQLNLSFSIDKIDNLFHFKLTEATTNIQGMSFHDQAKMVEYKHAFYFFESPHYELIKQIIEGLKESGSDTLVMRRKELETFLSVTLSQLKQIVDVTMDEEIQSLLYQAPFEAQLYMDTQNDNLLIRPVFTYGNVTIYPLEEAVSDSDDSIVVRQWAEESKVLGLLFEEIPLPARKGDMWELTQTDTISNFLYDALPALADYMEIFLSQSARGLLYSPSRQPKITMEMRESSNLLDISFDTEDISTDELKDLLKELEKNQSYYRLSSGQIVNLKDPAFQAMRRATNSLDLEDDEIEKDMTVSVFQGLSALEEDTIQTGKRFKELVKQLFTPEDLAFELPKKLNAHMRPYQVTGFKWLKSLDHYGFGGVLADDMGLGKTIQTIAFIQSKIEQEDGKYLIICPSSVLFNWQHEWDKFVPDTDTIIISGSKEEREAKRQEAIDKNISVWITSYPLIQRDSDLYEEDVFKTIILDESQNVKNSAAKTTKAVKRLNSETKVALSGTPIENHLGELWSLFTIIQPGLFRNKKAFQSMEHERIAAKIKPFILRRLKRDVLDDLPEKTETTEYIELSEGQKRLYQTQRAAIKQELKELVDADTLRSNRIKVLAGMTRLRQICCDPRLIMPDYEGESSKLERLMEYLEEARENGKRVVLFSQFTSMLKIIRERLDKIDVDYHYLDGQTKNEQRLELTTRFNTGEKDLFLISLKAGGTGLNLTGGDTVILFDSWWNPAIEDQAADRVHRFGQKKSVQIIRFITTGTIEERINDLQAKKRELIDSVITKGNKESVTSLSTEEILELLYED
ncbi:Superfamily II DNA or RNA helicase, SNF2 family [Alkalibacterium putridalgicola]|uniref:Helicase SNF2 n=1 Tax=Alkalibacterium putridalgicola TaxID=426703 RepID=A0A1H7RCR9_9LACT|nr:DEAD/DEAH box helicase [Alkalibacterium putridalgicola]GEK88819.1 helicase SNF2 [Alkalibacterium putridalgicola]SEL57758.1 Superfamily II DNA or RNA helicase, SNF2 family [Alkalibacterium putridalgicola]